VPVLPLVTASGVCVAPLNPPLLTVVEIFSTIALWVGDGTF
jgi:hypothetical protein